MGKKRLSIPIARFEPARALANDVFIYLVLNKRLVKIAEAQGAIAPELLERIKSKGYSHLEVSCDDDSSDPATYPLYLVSLPAEEDSETKLKKEALEQTTATWMAGEDGSGETQERISQDKGESEGSSRLSSESQEESLQRVSGKEEAEEEGSILVKAGSEASEGSLVSKAAGSEAPEEGMGSPANAGDNAFSVISPEAEKAKTEALSTEAEANEQTAIRAGQEEAPEERSAAAGFIDDGAQTIEGGPKDPAPVLFKAASEEEEDAPESAIFRLEQKLETAKETILAGGNFDLAQEKVSILRDAKSTILAAKISDRIIELKKLPDSKSDSSELTELTASLIKAEAGDDLSQETLGRFPMAKEMKEVETIISSDRPPADRVVDLSEHLATYAQSREEAKKLLDQSDEENEFGPLKKSAAHRDLPHTASRLAAYLGHSLGYTHPKFLSDLAISSVCHFGRKTGREIDESALPPLAKLMAKNADTDDSVIDDAREILAFLDLYLDDPECDRAEKEFIQKIFTRTAESATRDQKVGAWNLKCWTAYIEKGGPTLEAHSLCNRAAASAIKFLRTNAKD